MLVDIWYYNQKPYGQVVSSAVQKNRENAIKWAFFHAPKPYFFIRKILLLCNKYEEFIII